MDETCSNQGHPAPVAAAAKLIWPAGGFIHGRFDCEPAVVCADDIAPLVTQALDAGVPVEVWPIARQPDRDSGATRWRRAPDCDRCKDTGRFSEQGTEAHCGCKRGRRMSELWYASKHGHYHPDAFEPSQPPDPDGAPF